MQISVLACLKGTLDLKIKIKNKVTSSQGLGTKLSLRD